MRIPLRRRLLVAAALAALSATPSAQAAVMFTGVSYTQAFNPLPISPETVSLQSTTPWMDDTAASPTNSGIVGWYLYHTLDPGATEDGTDGHNRFRISPGTSGTGSFYSFGSTGSSDRALGDVGSTTIASNPPGVQDIYTGLRLTN